MNLHLPPGLTKGRKIFVHRCGEAATIRVAVPFFTDDRDHDRDFLAEARMIVDVLKSSLPMRTFQILRELL